MTGRRSGANRKPSSPTSIKNSDAAAGCPTCRRAGCTPGAGIRKFGHTMNVQRLAVLFDGRLFSRSRLTLIRTRAPSEQAPTNIERSSIGVEGRACKQARRPTLVQCRVVQCRELPRSRDKFGLAGPRKQRHDRDDADSQNPPPNARPRQAPADKQPVRSQQSLGLTFQLHLRFACVNDVRPTKCFFHRGIVIACQSENQGRTDFDLVFLKKSSRSNDRGGRTARFDRLSAC